ncbi:MAG: TIGR03032 family protein [Acidimicrobiia bacterium]
MRLPHEFIRLPLRIDAARLAAEVTAIDEQAWRPHPQDFAGNDALPLVSVGGRTSDDALRGEMAPTEHLAPMPYLRQVLASLDTVIGRTRLMRIEGNGEVSPHVDVSYYWADRVRVHVPIVTTPAVRFECGSRHTHMAAGEAWIFDTWRMHNVINDDEAKRIHLVIDTVGGAAFWDLVARGEVNPEGAGAGNDVVFRPDLEAALRFESVNFPLVMTPAELERLIDLVTDGARGAEPNLGRLDATLQVLRRDWRATWSEVGDTDPAAFAPLIDGATTALQALLGTVLTANGQDAASSVMQTVLSAAVNHDIAGGQPRRRRPAASSPRRAGAPVFIVSPPRSGSTLLFETLAKSPDLVTIGGESHRLIESMPELHPSAHGWKSNRVGADAATVVTVAELRSRFAAAVRDREGKRPQRGHQTTLLEKTPKNSLRIPFLAAAFPEARFVYLYRDPIDTLASMIEGWHSERFVTYPDLPGWDGPKWSFLLTPGWEELRGLEIPEIAARQWSSTVETMINDLESTDPSRWCVASYGRLIEEPQAEIERICEFLDIAWDTPLTAPLPLSKTTLTPPEPNKWRRLEDVLHPVLPIVAGASERAREVFANPPGRDRAVEAVKRKPAREPMTQEEIDAGFSSKSTPSFGELLDATSSSLLVSTYQTGRVIVVRQQGGRLNTHLRSFDLPMGIAVDGDRMVLGTRRELWDFRNQPAVARKIPPSGSHDACFVPRSCHITGDLRIHDVAIADGEIWAVNTLFSCLVTFDDAHSFVPRWQPSFVTALTPEDRCHLNGLAIVNGEPRYATALGTTDTAGGWRADKTSGGVVIDVVSNEIVARGLSMPHSPRWHNGQLWVLESGVGRLGRVDFATGTVETVAEVPGFTRGLAFAGPYAFVGLSQVRETLFEGVPIKERPDRACGVWVIDTRSGRTVAFLRFEGLVQEIFDVQVLAGSRFPDLVEPSDKRVGSSYVVPDVALAGVPAGLRG